MNQSFEENMQAIDFFQVLSCTKLENELPGNMERSRYTGSR